MLTHPTFKGDKRYLARLEDHLLVMIDRANHHVVFVHIQGYITNFVWHH
jgi:uncharacterized protein YbgA (DUF1722 family)